MDTVLHCEPCIDNVTFVIKFVKCTTEQIVRWDVVAIDSVLALLIYGIYLFPFYLCYNHLINRYFDKDSRKHALVTCLGAVVATFYVWAATLLLAYGFELVLYILPLPVPILFFLEANKRTRLQIRPTFTRNIPSIVAFLFSSVFFPVLFHFFPQRPFCECPTFSLFTMGFLYFVFVSYFTMFVFFIVCFWVTLTSEKLYLYENRKRKPIGYLTEKCGFWVKVVFPRAAAEPKPRLVEF